MVLSPPLQKSQEEPKSINNDYAIQKCRKKIVMISACLSDRGKPLNRDRRNSYKTLTSLGIRSRITLVPEAFIYSLLGNFATQTAFIIFVIGMKVRFSTVSTRGFQRSHRVMPITKIIKAVCVAKFPSKE